MKNKEIELVNDLWQLWEDIHMAGQLVTNKDFTPKYRELKSQVKNLNMHFVSGSLPFTFETLPHQIQEEMSKRHEHAELLDPEEICYKESDVVDIINKIYGNDR